MPSSDIKQDYSMEAGLLSTHGEERTMTKEEAELEDYYEDEEIDYSSDGTRTTSYARRALIALAVLGLLGIGLVSIGGAAGVCPGHLRHALNGEISIKEAVHSHKPNLSESMAQLARRQDSANTPGAPGSTDSAAGTTDAATQPSATAGTTEQPSETQPTATEATETEVTETQPTETQATETQATETQATETNEAPTTSEAQDTTQEASTSTQEDTPSSTEEVSESATSDDATTAAETTTEESQSTSEPDSTTSDSDEATSTDETTKATQKTITTGTRTTSSAVQKTYTSTMAQGGITTFTSTSWVAVVPPASATTTGDPNLQNAAPQSSVHRVLSAVIGMMFGGFLLL